MRIEFIEPLTRAWERMKDILWRPFDLAKWLVLGFSAWLANLAGGANSGWNFVFDDQDMAGRRHISSGGDWFHDVGDLLIWVPLILLLILAIAAIVVVVLWLSSRAKFIFLDNVINNRAQIVEPWHRYRAIGNTLFLWRLFFYVGLGLVALLVGLVLMVPAATLSVSDALSGLSFAAMGFAAVIMFLIAIVACYVLLFLEAFVVPIMYKYDLNAVESWRFFVPWFRARPWSFILYGLFVFGTILAAMIFAVIAFTVTCCVLTPVCCLIALPYVGTVVLLPLHVLYRLFSVEFLAQFDAGFDLYAPTEEVAD
jgi:hypothetical protein